MSRSEVFDNATWHRHTKGCIYEYDDAYPDKIVEVAASGKRYYGTWVNDRFNREGQIIDIVSKALEYASAKHKGQFRNGSGHVAYISHPVEVAVMIKQWNGWDDNTVAAALLHDTIEDTDATYEDILTEFGEEVDEMVRYCTELSTKSEGSRATRKKIDREHYARGPRGSQVIKVCDAIHNMSTLQGKGSFKMTYFFEKIDMINGFTSITDIQRI